VILII